MDQQNWMKVGMSLQLTAKALMPFCIDEMQSFKKKLDKNHGSNVCSAGCTSNDLKKKSFTCPSNVCNKWLAEIKAQSATSQFSLDNTTVSLWPVHHWQVAQCFMGPGQDPGNKDPHNTGPGGILQLTINCKLFQPLINIGKVEKVMARLVILLVHVLFIITVLF